MRPLAGRLVPCGVHKALVLRAGDRTHAQLEPIDEDAMRRSLVLVAELGAHGEPASRDRRKSWGKYRRARIGHRAIITRDLVSEHPRHSTCASNAPVSMRPLRLTCTKIR